jgi:hypothetical protein
MSKRKKKKHRKPTPPPPPPLPPTWREKYWKPIFTYGEVVVAIGLWTGGIAVTDNPPLSGFQFPCQPPALIFEGGDDMAVNHVDNGRNWVHGAQASDP